MTIFRRPRQGENIFQKMLIVWVNVPRTVSLEPSFGAGGFHPAVFIFVRFIGLVHQIGLHLFRFGVEKKVARIFWL